MRILYLLMGKKLVYTERLGRKLAKAAADPQIGKYHVITYYSKPWAVVTKTSKRALRLFDTKREAIAFAKKHGLAKSKGEDVEIVIHDNTAMVIDRKIFKAPKHRSKNVV
jgi:Uncharacterized protein conserved in bacteria (DUF2188)